jgi:hypothetical protein
VRCRNSRHPGSSRASSPPSRSPYWYLYRGHSTFCAAPAILGDSPRPLPDTGQGKVGRIPSLFQFAADRLQTASDDTMKLDQGCAAFADAQPDHVGPAACCEATDIAEPQCEYGQLDWLRDAIGKTGNSGGIDVAEKVQCQVELLRRDPGDTKRRLVSRLRLQVADETAHLVPGALVEIDGNEHAHRDSRNGPVGQ